jgi:hypothetical protein
MGYNTVTKSQLMTLKFEIEHHPAMDLYDEDFDVTCIPIEPRGQAKGGPCVCAERGDETEEAMQAYNERGQCDGCWVEGDVENLGPEYFLKAAEVTPTKSCIITIKGYMICEKVGYGDWGTEYDTYFEPEGDPVIESVPDNLSS